MNNKTAHDFKKISQTLRLLADEIDELFNDVTKEEKDGNIKTD